MMFGLRDEFKYMECSACGCLQLTEIPEKMDKYYPENYYSFSQVNLISRSRLSVWLQRQKTRLTLKGTSIFRNHKLTKNERIFYWVRRSGINVSSKILDVGCGTGALLVELYQLGFKDLTGVDPYVSRDYIYHENVRIYKRELNDLDGKFDLIMLHHCFEHLQDPQSTLSLLFNLLAPRGMILIRIPTVSSLAWRKYTINWIQLDAPRHFFLHSVNSMQLLAKQAGFSVEFIEYDSTAFQFWGSELYVKGITYTEGRKTSYFNGYELYKFNQAAKKLNTDQDGDQACFYLKKSTDF
jgi:2-polyprenyl-3-methyl-5-hydroxy-6-metoxy-1,4-benzoquinol methylase